MAQTGLQLDRETFSCSICLDLLNNPVTLQCGHNYCMTCISTHWDEEEIPSCPQCRQVFNPRPVLVKNTMLAAVVEQLKKTELQDAPADLCYAGPEDVACDICTGKKQKAVKSCLRCLVSYCEEHLQPHYHVDQFKKHQLVEPSKKLKENICPHHDEVIKMFCRTHQQCICIVCSMDQHKGHNTVSLATERINRQTELEQRRQKIQQSVQGREKDVKLLQQEVEALNLSADKTQKNNKKTLTELICLMKKKQRDLEQQVMSQQKTEVGRVKELQDKLEQEITELKRKDAELEQLSHTQDDTQFLHSFLSLAPHKETADSSSIHIRPLRHFEDVTPAVSELRDELQDLLEQEWTNISETVTEVDVLLSPPKPRTRDRFLKYSCKLTLDLNTAHVNLSLSEGNQRVTLSPQTQVERCTYSEWGYDSYVDQKRRVVSSAQTQRYPPHPERFTDSSQIVSKETLTGRCYWEVEWKGKVDVAVAYKTITRKGQGQQCLFGHNDKSWSLRCLSNQYEFYHADIVTSVSGPQSSRVGVYLNHKAGVLSFYSVSKTMILLHRVKTTFTEPLCAGFRIWSKGDTVKFSDLI